MNEKPKSPAKSASKKKVVIRDLKAKNAGSVKGGVGSTGLGKDRLVR
jgi:hypothetical protein